MDFEIEDLVLARTVIPFTTSDFFQSWNVFPYLFLYHPMVSILGFGILIWHFVCAQEESSKALGLSWPKPKGVLREL